MTEPAYVLVWDLDHTLGVFDPLEQVLDPTEPVTVHLRPGIAAALERLSAAGFTHTVLSLASPSYAEMALRGTGLRHHFVEVAGAGMRPKGDAHGVAQAVGLPVERCADRMIFVGDHLLFDPPQDHQVVFHLEGYALRRPAELVVALLLALREQGSGSLRAGFDALLGVAHPSEPLPSVDLADLGRLLLAPRDDAAPVLVFDDDTLMADEGGDHTAVSFIPAQVDFATIF